MNSEPEYDIRDRTGVQANSRDVFLLPRYLCVSILSIFQQKHISTMWPAEAPEYIFRLSLGLIALVISCLLLVPPHPSPVVKRQPIPPLSRSPSPEAPAIIEPYNEDEIVSAMNAIYDILIQLDQITPGQLIYPPAPASGNMIQHRSMRVSRFGSKLSH